MDATRQTLLLTQVYEELKCVLCQFLPKSPVGIEPCGHIVCQECVAAWTHAAKKHCPECVYRPVAITGIVHIPAVETLLARLLDECPEISQLETLNLSPTLVAAKSVQAEEAGKTIDMELDPDGLDSRMSLVTHRYFRLPDTASAKVVLKAVKMLMGAEHHKPTHLFVTAGKAQKQVLLPDMTMRDVKWLFEHEEIKKMTLYYTSRP